MHSRTHLDANRVVCQCCYIIRPKVQETQYSSIWSCPWFCTTFLKHHGGYALVRKTNALPWLADREGTARSAPTFMQTPIKYSLSCISPANDSLLFIGFWASCSLLQLSAFCYLPMRLSCLLSAACATQRVLRPVPEWCRRGTWRLSVDMICDRGGYIETCSWRDR